MPPNLMQRQENAEYVVEVIECLKEELHRAAEAGRRAVLEERHVQSLRRGIDGVRSGFDDLQRSTDEFRRLTASSLAWLDRKGISCQAMARVPHLRYFKTIDFFSQKKLNRLLRRGLIVPNVSELNSSNQFFNQYVHREASAEKR